DGHAAIHVVEQLGESGLTLLAGLFGLFALRRVENNPLDGEQAAVWGEDAAALIHNPSLSPPAVEQTVFHLEQTFLLDALLNRIPHPRLILGIDQVGKSDGSVVNKFFRRIAGQLLAAVADKFHAPGQIILAAVN